jgi:hypothetical protein
MCKRSHGSAAQWLSNSASFSLFFVHIVSAFAVQLVGKELVYYVEIRRLDRDSIVYSMEHVMK